MVDLPQHAAQISIWKNLSDPRFGFAPYFELEMRTPFSAQRRPRVPAIPTWTQAGKGRLYEQHLSAFYLAREAAAHYDTFVVRDDATDAALAARLFHSAAGISLVASAGAWHLFRATTP